MFVSPAFEELTGTSPDRDTAAGQQRSLPSSVHDPPAMDDYSSSTAYSEQRGRSSSELDSYQRELARQLANADQQTFQRVKQAIQTLAQQQSGSSSLHNLIQESRERVRQVLEGQNQEGQGYFASVANAVTSAGSAIGQFGNQILGAGEIQEEVTTEDASLKAEEVLQPLREYAQSQQSDRQYNQSSAPGSASQHTSQAGDWTTGDTGSKQADAYARDATDRARNVREQQLNQMSDNQRQAYGDEQSAFTREEEMSAPTGYFTRHSTGGQGSGPGNERSAFQHTTEAGNWTTGETGSEAAHAYESDATERARQVRERQMEQGALQNAGDLQERPVDKFSRSSHHQSETNSLHGDAQRVGLEEARRRARQPF